MAIISAGPIPYCMDSVEFQYSSTLYAMTFVIIMSVTVNVIKYWELHHRNFRLNYLCT